MKLMTTVPSIYLLFRGLTLTATLTEVMLADLTLQSHNAIKNIIERNRKAVLFSCINCLFCFGSAVSRDDGVV